MEPGYVYTILGADVSYFLCCTTSATKEIGARLHAGKIAFASARKPYRIYIASVHT